MPAVRPATPADVPGAARALADAFRTDPVWRWLADERADWTDGATRWFSAYLRHQLAHGGEVLVDEGVHGCAVWLPPGRWRGTLREGLALTVPSARLFRTGLVRALRNLAAVERAHPTTRPTGTWACSAPTLAPGRRDRQRPDLGRARPLRRAGPRGVPRIVEGGERPLLRPSRLRGGRRDPPRRRTHHVADVARPEGLSGPWA
ncbi:MAG: hypothetical protein R2711_08825 [Acidimicrobiales bacterium]